MESAGWSEMEDDVQHGLNWISQSAQAYNFQTLMLPTQTYLHYTAK